MAPMYYRNANAALIVYDITSIESFEAVSGWVNGKLLCGLSSYELVFFYLEGRVCRMLKVL